MPDRTCRQTVQTSHSFLEAALGSDVVQHGATVMFAAIGPLSETPVVSSLALLDCLSTLLRVALLISTVRHIPAHARF